MGFEHRIAGLATGRLPGNGVVAFVGGDDADKCKSGGKSVSVNALEGLATPDKHSGVGRLTNSREKAPYEG